MAYSSKDFGKTKSVLETRLPEKLIHKQVVRDDALDHQFSRERKHPVFVVDLPTENISMTIGGLDPAQSTNRHRHTYETVFYILEGEGFTEVEDQKVFWTKGDAVFVPRWAWHKHTNTSAQNRCLYIACENAPQLQNLGVAIREEE